PYVSSAPCWCGADETYGKCHGAG
ncbi:SEC-C metal-binding domain-containing protein, partial [Streptomyces corynorhini]